MVISQEKEDAVYNALAVGMTLDDAYLYARLTPEELVAVTDSPSHQAKFAQYNKQTEFALLDRMRHASITQTALGKSEATQWLLEHLYPRYSSKSSGNDIGRITLAVADASNTKLSIVE